MTNAPQIPGVPDLRSNTPHSCGSFGSSLSAMAIQTSSLKNSEQRWLARSFSLPAEAAEVSQDVGAHLFRPLGPGGWIAIISAFLEEERGHELSYLKHAEFVQRWHGPSTDLQLRVRLCHSPHCADQHRFH